MDIDNGGQAVHGANGSPGLRERKKLATRQALSAAAIRLALEQGFDNVRVEDIAEAAGVSPRTFNNYFSSREEAIIAARHAQVERMAQALLARPAEESLLEALGNAMAAGHDHPAGYDHPTDYGHPAGHDHTIGHDHTADRDYPTDHDHPSGYSQSTGHSLSREPAREVTRLFLCNPSLHAEFLRSAAHTKSPMIDAVAQRTGTSPDDLLPQVVTSAALGALRAAMQKWLADEASPPFQDLLRDALNQLRALADNPDASAPDRATRGEFATTRATPEDQASAESGVDPSRVDPPGVEASTVHSLSTADAHPAAA